MRHFIMLSMALAFSMPAAGQTDPYADAIQVFRNAEASNLFDSAYGYAVFRTIGKAGFGVGKPGKWRMPLP